MHNLLVCVALLLPANEDSWESLALPGIAEPAAVRPAPAALLDGSHLLVEPERRNPGRAAERSLWLPPTALLELIEGDALRRGEALRVHRPVPPLLVRGSESARGAARELLRGLDLAGRALDIEVETLLVPTFDGGGSAVLAPGSLPSRAAEFADTDASRERAVTRSGDALVFGARKEEAFLSTFDVQVASGSGAPDPVFGSISTGRTLHLSAWRVAGGQGVFLAGLLDLAELSALTTTDPGTSDLGRLDKPEVHLAQVAFSGRVDSGGSLRVALRGLPLSQPDWTLWVTARTQPDVAAGWGLADLALLESVPAELPLPSPGVGIHSLADLTADAQPIEPLTTAALYGEVQVEARRLGRSDRRSPFAYVPGLLAGPAEEAELWNEIRALASAAESPRTRTATLRASHGEAEVVLPVSSSVPARFLVGRESTFLTGYRVEIATDTWMAAPEVRVGLDGALLQGRLVGGAFACAYWTATSESTGVLGRGDTGHGRVERVRRGYRGGRARISDSAPATRLVPDVDDLPGLVAELRLP